MVVFFVCYFFKIFQRRRDASVDFYRNWKEYQNGFGNKSDNYWLGNYNYLFNL